MTTRATAQHTPGPWMQDEDAEAGERVIHSGTGELIAWLSNGHGRAEANARLMAVAPEMLELLRFAAQITSLKAIARALLDRIEGP